MNTLERLSHHLQRTYFGAFWCDLVTVVNRLHAAMLPARKEWVEVQRTPAQLRARRNRDKRRGLL